MGITKRPASICSDELLLTDVDEPREIEIIVTEDTASDYDFDDNNDDLDSLNSLRFSSVLREGLLRYSPTGYGDVPLSFPTAPIYDSSDEQENEPIHVSNDEPENEPNSISPPKPNNSSLNHQPNHDNINVDTKLLAFKKKNISQMGRRKANRAQNDHFLLSLSADQQQNPEDEIFYNDNRNGFTKVINKLCIRPDLKESFIEGNDEVILQKSNKRSAAEMNYSKKSKRSVRPEVAFKNLTTSQKSLFKQKSLPFTAINQLETEVVRYFSRTPNGVYTSAPLPSYHRMLLHSIVRYYSLDATSVNSRGRRNQKIVQVRNSRFDDFLPPQMSLLKFITLI